MSARRRRSVRSYVIDIALTAVLVAGLYLWMTNGGPEWFVHWFADYLSSSR